MLLDLTTYKTLKGMNVLNTKDDAQITALITSVSSMIMTYIGYDFLSYYAAFKTEYYNGASPSIMLDIYPIVEGSVTAFYLDADNVYQALVLNEDFYIDYENDAICTVSGSNFVASPRPRTIKVVYKAGLATGPTDIVLAAADLVEYYLKQERSTNKTMGGAETMQFDATPFGRMPNHIARILDMYRVALK